MKLNAANIITLLRIFLVPVFVLFVMLSGEGWQIAAVAVFVAASISDKVDGYIARKYNMITSLGKLLDPLADKILTFAAFSLFCASGLMHPVALMFIITRELAVASLRTVAAAQGLILAADLSGKIKTALQMTCVITVLALPFVVKLLSIPLDDDVLRTVNIALCWLCAAVTAWSGIDYFVKNRKFFKGI